MPIRKDYYDDEYEYYDDVDSNNNADDDTVAEDDYYEDNRDGEAVLFPSSPAASSDFFSGGDSTHLYPAYRDSKLSRGIGCFTEAIPKCFSLSSHLCCGCFTECKIGRILHLRRVDIKSVHLGIGWSLIHTARN